MNSRETFTMIRRWNLGSEGQLSLKAEDADLSVARKVSITDMSEGRFNKSQMNMPDCCKFAESRLLFASPLGHRDECLWKMLHGLFVHLTSRCDVTSYTGS